MVLGLACYGQGSASQKSSKGNLLVGLEPFSLLCLLWVHRCWLRVGSCEWGIGPPVTEPSSVPQTTNAVTSIDNVDRVDRCVSVDADGIIIRWDATMNLHQKC